jgi:hypothetical protein
MLLGFGTKIFNLLEHVCTNVLGLLSAPIFICTLTKFEIFDTFYAFSQIAENSVQSKPSSINPSKTKSKI